jgi:1,4-alpha-glucan branching enzyme
VHGKGSLIGKMPGDYWQKFANLRLLYSYMYGHPGKKLLFMGCEFGQWWEWNHDGSLDWNLLEYPSHQGLHRLVTDLNMIYRTEPALHELDFAQDGFEWIDIGDWGGSVISFIRKNKTRDQMMLVVCNCTPVPRYGYKVGVPKAGLWKEILNSDGYEYGGSGLGNFGGIEAENVPMHGRKYSLRLILPPLATIYLKHTEQ